MLLTFEPAAVHWPSRQHLIPRIAGGTRARHGDQVRCLARTRLRICGERQRRGTYDEFDLCRRDGRKSSIFYKSQELFPWSLRGRLWL